MRSRSLLVTRCSQVLCRQPFSPSQLISAGTARQARQSCLLRTLLCDDSSVASSAKQLSVAGQRRAWAANAAAGSQKAGITQSLGEQLEGMKARHDSIVQTLSGDGCADLPARELQALNKELADLTPVVEALGAVRRAEEEAAELQGLADDRSDPAMAALAGGEREALLAALPDLQRRLLLRLLPKDEADSRSAVLEVRAGTGGDEAALFAMDLFRMYQRHVAAQGWRWEQLSLLETEVGGCKAGSAAVTGDGAYGRLKFEAGIHRVQRVPVTEKSGRVHTSAAAVSVLVQADEVDVSIRDEDLRIDTYRSSGAGGQHVNTTDSAVRVTHLPSGIVVAMQDERSQHKNKAKALKVLRAQLYKLERERAASAASADRMAQAGSGDRSEKIRTYNFPQGRVTDHRVGVTQNDIEAVLAGERLDEFIDAMQQLQQRESLASLQGP